MGVILFRLSLFEILANPLMHYFSTNKRSPHSTFREAVLAGQPDDRGLYFPSEVPRLRDDFLSEFSDLDNGAIAFNVIRPYVNGEIGDDALREICEETVNFEFPLVELNEKISALELFHGPTLAFKDVGARFMSRCLRQFSSDQTEKTIVVVATSGDTGGAVAAGFHNVDGIEVVIIYPKGKVSRVQELQLTTLGGNVTTLELHGNFDDCQALAKQALADGELRKQARLTSANSINVARWLPQQFYYFFALKQWQDLPPIISVPSGNFGNLAAGVLAHASGLPVERFIAACNANDVVPRYFASKQYEPHDTIATLSNAMDVGDPSNFVRILEVVERQFPEIGSRLNAVSIDDDVTARTMQEIYADCNYTLDPHGAVAFRALADHLAYHPDSRGIFLETAHPVKFDSVLDITGTQGEMPAAISEMEKRERVSIEIENDYDAVRDVILSKV